jgi:hypothetical protein
MTIIKKIVGVNKKAWDNKIKFSIWVDKITKNSVTWKIPFEPAYGLDVTLLMHLRLPTYQLLQGFNTNKDASQIE